MVRIAIYMRLSKEDEKNCRKEESNSIRNQRALAEAYVKDHFKEYKLLEFQDDGYTGTNFDRPGVTALLKEVKDGKIDCIVVKDFSRFSRDYIELGSYIEQIFPFMKVRFISINDRYDSDEREQRGGILDIRFKHLLYDLYSKDLSVKVKSSLEVKKKQGLYISGNCPFGYEKAAGNRHMLVIAEDEAQVVRKIFDMSASGFTSSQIAKVFNQEGIKTPIQFKMEKGRSSRAPKGGRFVWENTMICAILRNRVYVGDMIYGRYERLQVGGKNRQKPKDEWKIFMNHHEPIIEREVFEAVQERRGSSKNVMGERKTEERHPLTGKLFCGCCGRSLTYRNNNRNPYFYCSRRYASGMGECVSNLNGVFAGEVVLYELWREYDRCVSADQAKAAEWERKQREEEARAGEIAEGKKRVLSCQKQKIAAYERLIAARNKKGDGTAEEMLMKEAAEICRREEKKLAKLEVEGELTGSKAERRKKERPAEVYLGQEGILRLLESSKLTEELVKETVERIAVTANGEMEIFWKSSAFCGVLQTAAQTAI